MAFTNNFRIERIYFEKLKSNIDILKSYIEAGATGEALELLKNSVDLDGAVLLLYRNLGEAWAELADLIQKTQKEVKDLAEKTEAYHDELNGRIDEVNNYLMALIRELDARLQAVEQDLATMNRNKFYDLVENNGSYLIEKDGETVSFDEIKADADFPHDIILRYDNGTSVTELEVREFTDSRIDFYSIGLSDSDTTVKEVLVSIDDSEAVTYSEKTLENPLYTFGTGLSLDSNNELSVDTSVIQEKLTEGFGIDIDSNNEIKVDTAQVQEKLIAGQNITLTPDTTDPTKTVIDAQGGASYTAGNNIGIKNNVINFLGKKPRSLSFTSYNSNGGIQEFSTTALIDIDTLESLLVGSSSSTPSWNNITANVFHFIINPEFSQTYAYAQEDVIDGDTAFGTIVIQIYITDSNKTWQLSPVTIPICIMYKDQKLQIKGKAVKTEDTIIDKTGSTQQKTNIKTEETIMLYGKKRLIQKVFTNSSCNLLYTLYTASIGNLY